MRIATLLFTLSLLPLAAPRIRAGEPPISAPASAAGTAAPVKTGPGTLEPGRVGADLVTYQVGDETVRGYLAWPGGPGPFPAVVMIHEWWGLTPWIKTQARKVAGMGYVVLAVDLYRGEMATDAARAHELMRGLPEDRADRYLLAGFNYLAGQPYIKRSPIGAIGWCMGGGYAARLAVLEPRLKAAVINYGALPEDVNKIKGIKAALLGNFGALDTGIPKGDIEAFAKKFRDGGGRIEVHIQNSAGHGFMNETNPNHNVAAAADSWIYIRAFLTRELGGKAQADYIE